MKSFKNNEERAKWAKIGLTLIIIITVILTVSNAFQLELLLGWNNGAEVDMNEAEINDTRQEIVVMAYYIFRCLGAVAFLLWFRRAYFNLHQKSKALNYDEGWAVGAWFVPILNLFRPYKIMKELYAESSFWLKTNGIKVNGEAGQYVLPWWLLWVLTTFLGRIVNKLPEETVSELVELTQVAIAAGIIEVIAALIALKVVHNYSNREKLMMDLEKQLELRNDRSTAPLDSAEGQDADQLISPLSP
ncbi:DUF4328 domain-containing protein [Algoriphagus sp. AGSA1]|uniref:DUF4328 domain-containing protein n=1 Tax=Algoriphagus sp. AGSA1 TaxID=2907213 RepID=UPI001F3913E5|nr:DUF4328 domain-containing protein [Algoriphagus sp. AGSA1]MCE7055046.1 DUF4328 domain-containing protein [Algoriphagus sp. AGSA1]